MPQDTISIIGREMPPVLQPTPRNKNPESKPIEPDRAKKFSLAATEEQKRNTLDNNIVKEEGKGNILDNNAISATNDRFKGIKVDIFV